MSKNSVTIMHNQKFNRNGTSDKGSVRNADDSAITLHHIILMCAIQEHMYIPQGLIKN